MRRALFGALLSVVALAAPVPPAGAEQALGALDLEVTYDCYGCGPTFATITGTSLAGEGAFRPGATITGWLFSNEPAATCPATGSANGTLTSSAGGSLDFSWTYVGQTLHMTTTSGAGEGTFIITSPPGSPCGGPATARVLVGVTADVRNPSSTLPAPRGHVTIHRFPTSTGSNVGGVRLWAAPVAQNGWPWTCRDIHTGVLVAQGSVLSSPDPGVTCVPPVTYSDGCQRVDAGGYHADAGSGTVRVESTCAGGVTASATVQVPSSWPAFSRSQVGDGRTPWTCQAHESLANAAETDYWVFCDVNLA